MSSLHDHLISMGKCARRPLGSAASRSSHSRISARQASVFSEGIAHSSAYWGNCELAGSRWKLTKQSKFSTLCPSFMTSLLTLANHHAHRPTSEVREGNIREQKRKNWVR